MVEKEGYDLFLQQMRETPGYEIWLQAMRDQYLKLVRKLSVGSCSTIEDLNAYRNSIASIRDAVMLTGMSKEDVIKWMEIR